MVHPSVTLWFGLAPCYAKNSVSRSLFEFTAQYKGVRARILSPMLTSAPFSISHSTTS